METRARTTCRRTCVDDGRRRLRIGNKFGETNASTWKKDEFLQRSTSNKHVVPWRVCQPHRCVENDSCEAKQQEPVGDIHRTVCSAACWQHGCPPSHRSSARDLVQDKLHTSAFVVPVLCVNSKRWAQTFKTRCETWLVLSLPLDREEVGIRSGSTRTLGCSLRRRWWHRTRTW